MSAKGRPVLRWHGGKWLLAPWIISHFQDHRVYVEPFGGAASDGRSIWVPTAIGLVRRGLIEHRHNPNWKGEHRSAGEINDYYRLTRAGWLMHDLLAEAGLVKRVESRKQRSLVA